MPDPAFGLTQSDRSDLAGVVAKHYQRLPDAGRRTRRVWPLVGGPGSNLGGNNTGCCAASVCAPASPPVTDCTEVPKLLAQYGIDGAGIFAPTSNLSQDSLCVYKTTCFEVFCNGVSWGTHYWKWTIVEDEHQSTLELLPCEGSSDLNVVYRNLSLLNAYHSNRFALTRDWEISPAALAHLFPCELCVYPVGAPCVLCPEQLVETLCCPDNDLPQTLYATITNNTSCGCITATVIPLTYNAGGGFWSGGGTVACDAGFSLAFTLRCIDPGVWQLDQGAFGSPSGGTCTTALLSLTGPTAACDPFSLLFASVQLNECCGGIGTTGTVDITITP